MSTAPSLVIHGDGSFDLVVGGLHMTGCYPGLNGRALRPLAVAVRTDGVSYMLDAGRALHLTFGQDVDGLWIDTRLEGFTTLPHRVAVFEAAVQGATGAFRQGKGMGRRSGWIPWPDQGGRSSYTLTGVQHTDGWLVISSRDLTTWPQECEFYAAQPHHVPPRLDAAFKCEGIPGRGTVALPRLHLTAGHDAWELFRAEAGRIAAITPARPAAANAYHWCSWYYRYYTFSRDDLDSYLAAFPRPGQPGAPETIQIDAGYCDHAGDWLEPNSRWPGGLEAAAKAISAAGYRPGIWIGPYMVGNRSRLYRDHPDWVLRRHDGTPFQKWPDWFQFYGENRNWGSSDEEYYCLDTGHPAAAAWLAEVLATLRRWGFTFFKTDFLKWGFQDSSSVLRHDRSRTSLEQARASMALIRRAIGDDAYLLGCIAGFAPILGFVEAARTGADVGPTWDSCQNMIVEAIGTQHLNRLWFQNDPDCLPLRQFHINLGATERQSLSLFMGLLGGVVNTSDPLHLLDADGRALWELLEPGAEPWTARIADWPRPGEIITVVRERAGAPAQVLLFNRGATAQAVVPDLAALLSRSVGSVARWTPTGVQAVAGTQPVLRLAARESALLLVG